MKTLVLLYIGICILAIALKYILKGVQHFSEKKSESDKHEQEHTIAHAIKFIILIIIAVLLMFVKDKNNL